MERTRYFRSANPFNISWNALSGNIFPLTDEKTNLSFALIMWVLFGWLVKIVHCSAALLGTIYFANLTPKDAFKKSGVLAAVCIELLISTVYINLRRNNFRHLISKYNDILIDSDDLKKLIRDTIEPSNKGLKFYAIACIGSVCAWSAAPIFKIFDNDQFTYVDFTVPAYFPGAPFGTQFFLAGVILQILGACFIDFAKISIDVYISYFVAVLSAEYKYVRAQAFKALSQEKDQEDEILIIGALQKCVKHHSAMIEIGQELSEILAFHMGTKYLGYILRFCFLAFGVVTLGSDMIERISHLVYAFACVVQAYLFCSCVQELFDASTSVTEDAFHENWHGRGSAVKKIFCIMEMSNQITCRLSAYGILDLIVPTLAVILSKSYSFSLLLLEVN